MFLLALATLGLEACSKGGSAVFYNSVLSQTTPTNPNIQVAIGGAYLSSTSGGYASQVLIKTDSAPVLQGNGYEMTFNLLKTH